MTRSIRSLVAIVTVVALAACSSAGGVAPPSPQSQVVASSARQPVKGRLVMRIRVPKRKHARHTGAHYVSPATQGMTVAITGPTVVSEVVGLTPASPGCSSTSAGTTCAVTFDLTACAAANCYSASIATYDAVSCSPTCTIPPGAHELSAAQNVVFSVRRGQNNVANLALGGIPASITATPVQPGYLQGDAHRLQVWGAAPQKLAIAALDADGNTIVGSGAPAISASPSSATLSVTSPKASGPSTVLLAATTTGLPPAVTPGSVALSVTVTPAADSGGAPLALTVPVAIAHSAVYVGLSTNAINVYYDGNTSATPNLVLAGANTTLNIISQLVVDGNGTLYVSNGVPNGAISEFPPGAQGDVAPSVTISGAATGMYLAWGLALDAKSTLYVANFSANSVTEYTQGASGNVAPLVTIKGGATGFSEPECAALDASGTLYIANFAGVNVLEFQSGANGNATPAVSIAGSNLKPPHCVATDGSGALYVSDEAPSIKKFAPGASGNAPPVATITGSLTELATLDYGLALDAAGNIFVGQQSGTESGVLEYAAGANGNVAPIASFSTGDVYALYVIPATNVNVITP
jgi:hypothetical protein